jgi:hypothetical protein
MSACTVKLLNAACEIVGGTAALADRLGLDEALLEKFMADVWPLPDRLLLKAVDIILADRQSRFSADPPTTQQTAVKALI